MGFGVPRHIPHSSEIVSFFSLFCPKPWKTFKKLGCSLEKQGSPLENPESLLTGSPPLALSDLAEESRSEQQGSL